MKTKELLDARRVSYKLYPHEETDDAQHLAAVLHVPGRYVVKTVLLRANGGYRYVVAVLPATERLDLRRMSETLGGAAVRLATEMEIAARCPDCEFGILPPFGSRFAMETIVDETVAQQQDMFFDGDTHREAIRMKFRDFYALEHPRVSRIVCPKSEMEDRRAVAVMN
jgi:Ala-tRNA(Pro) deacylase